MNKDLRLQEAIEMKTTLKELWHMLTDPEEIKAYFWGTEVTTDWKAGSPISFKGEWEHQTYEDKGTIIDIQPEKLIRYNYWSSFWGEDISPDERSIITYQIREISDGFVELMVIQEGFKDEQSLNHSKTNWNGIMNNIKNIIEKKHQSPL